MKLGCKGWKHKNPKTHCKYGHEFTEENTYTPPGTKKRCCRICRLNSTSKYVENNRETVNRNKRSRRSTVTKEQRRKENLRQIGWTVEIFNVQLETQEGKCAICKKALTFEDKITGSRACADHLHTKPPKPRGILCTNCNLGIGNLQENYEIMEAAIAYVKKHNGG